jgi:hypothetical protein
MSDLDTTSNPGRLPSRKRVVAREVEAANVESAGLTPEVITPPLPPPALEPPAVVDPTLLGGRHRRSSHLKVYRCTQALTMLSAGLAVAGMIWTLLADDISTGQMLSGTALLLGLVASVLSGLNSLAARWRGWAIASAVFAAAVLGLTAVHKMIANDSPGDRGPRVRDNRGQ